jgi:hypothetical protein
LGELNCVAIFLDTPGTPTSLAVTKNHTSPNYILSRRKLTVRKQSHGTVAIPGDGAVLLLTFLYPASFSPAASV